MKENNNTNYYTNVSSIFGQLDNIGKRLSDFKEIQKNKQNYFLLGRGYFGYVEKMKSRINNTIYAIKKLRKDGNTFNVKNFRRETQIMIDLKHDNIIKFYGYFRDKERTEKFNEIYSYEPEKQIKNQEYVEIYCLVFEFAPMVL